MTSGTAAASSGTAQAPRATPQPAGRQAKRRAPGGGIDPVVNSARLHHGGNYWHLASRD
jgi:hypothetical protein